MPSLDRTNKAFAQRVKRAEWDLSAARLATAGAVTATTIEVKIAPDAVVIGYAVEVTEAFVGATTCTIDVGDGTTADKYIDAVDLKTEADTAGVATWTVERAGSLVGTVTVTVEDLEDLTAGRARVRVFYI